MLYAGRSLYNKKNIRTIDKSCNQNRPFKPGRLLFGTPFGYAGVSLNWPQAVLQVSFENEKPAGQTAGTGGTK